MDKSQGNCKNQEDQSFYNDRKLEQEEEDEEAVANTGCFRNLSCFNWWRTKDVDGKFLLNHSEQKQKESWLAQKLKSVKEASEVIAGPRWKNFIRKLGGYLGQGNKSKKTRFQYDSHSYALNFDDPVEEDNERLFVGFSARFAPPLKHDQLLSGI